MSCRYRNYLFYQVRLALGHDLLYLYDLGPQRGREGLWPTHYPAVSSSGLDMGAHYRKALVNRDIMHSHCTDLIQIRDLL